MITGKMYALLCSACSEAIDALDQNKPLLARYTLQKALLEAEELYIETEEGIKEDAAWEKLMQEFAAHRGNIYILENQRLQKDHSAAVPEFLRKKMLAMLQSDNE